MVTAHTQTDEQAGLSQEEAWALFEEETRRYLDMSADEFVRRYQARELPDTANIEYLLAVWDFAS